MGRRNRRRPANRSPESYLSNDPERRARQLQNLGQHPGRQPLHGAYAQLAPDRVDAKVGEVFEALAEDAPLRERDGGLPAADTVAVRMLAEVLCRLESVTVHLRDFGVLDQQTREVRPAVHVEAKLRREVADWLDALGMTPRARARLGLDVARAQGGAFDLAARWAEEDIEGESGEWLTSTAPAPTSARSPARSGAR